MTITDIKVGEVALVKQIDQQAPRGYLQQLFSIGLIKGVEITCIRKSLLNNLLHFEVGHSVIILRAKEAKFIDIKVLNINLPKGINTTTDEI